MSHSLDMLADQMLDWVDDNIGGLTVNEAEGLKAEFKRLCILAHPADRAHQPHENCGEWQQLRGSPQVAGTHNVNPAPPRPPSGAHP
jgi:hypothetical protein